MARHFNIFIRRAGIFATFLGAMIFIVFVVLAAPEATLGLARADVIELIAIAVSIVSTALVLLTIQHSSKSINLESTALIVVEALGAEQVRIGRGEIEPNQVLFRIRNVGRGPVFVTGLYREWCVLGQSEGYSAYPEPIDPVNVRKSARFKKVSIPVGGNSYSETIFSNSGDYLSAFKVAEPSDWVFFAGFVEFESLEGRKFRSGFLLVYRPDQSERGLHLALPEREPDKYNYQKEL